jgi:hypothetical protein
MSFMLEETPVYEQPLLIEFEAKSIAKKFPMAKEHMQKKYDCVTIVNDTMTLRILAEVTL